MGTHCCPRSRLLPSVGVSLMVSYRLPFPVPRARPWRDEEPIPHIRAAENTSSTGFATHLGSLTGSFTGLRNTRDAYRDTASVSRRPLLIGPAFLQGAAPTIPASRDPILTMSKPRSRPPPGRVAHLTELSRGCLCIPGPGGWLPQGSP